MDWKFGSTETDWIFGSTAFEPSSVFSITSAPSEINRGGTFSIVCQNVAVPPSSATLNGQPVTINSNTENEINLTVSANTIVGHGSATLAVTVAGVTDTVEVTLNPPAGWSYVTLTSYDPGPGDVLVGMTSASSGEPISPVAGAQIIYQTVTAPSSYGVVFKPDGSVEFIAGGTAISGSETFQVRYLIPGTDISNIQTVTASDYVIENVPPVWSTAPTLSGVAGASLSFNLAQYASDANGDSLTFAKVSGAGGITVSASGVATGTLSTGSHSFVASVTDGKSSPVLKTFNITISSAPVEEVPTFRPAHPLRYFNEFGEITLLSNVGSIPYAIFSKSNGGAISGTRLHNGTTSTNANGEMPDISHESLTIGQDVEVLFKPVGRAILVDGTVIDGAA